MSARGMDIAAFEANRDEGSFDHLRGILPILSQDAELGASVCVVLAGQPCPSPEAFYRLRSAGMLSGGSVGDARLRCRLYGVYLTRHLDSVA